MSTGLGRTLELLEKLLKSKKNLSDKLVAKGEEASFNEPFDSLTQKAADYVPKTYILVDENGNETVAALVSQETCFDATENDVREGKNFVSDLGAKTGKKVIPSYHTTEGYRLITNGSVFQTSPFSPADLYDYTKLQAIICPFNESINLSVAADKIAINENVYVVNSSEAIATVTKDGGTKTINLGLTNNSGKPYVLRYFTYKEIY